jgi:hypothetical protein
MDLFTCLFDAPALPWRWDCGVWTPAEGWLHIPSDLAVWSAHLPIPGMLQGRHRLPGPRGAPRSDYAHR